MILREMPPTWDPTFRPWFYSRWGKENCIIGAHTAKVEYPSYEQTLSIKAAWGGREDYFVDGRRIAVDDDTFLILNNRRKYSSVISAGKPVTSFSIFFRPGMAEDVFHTITSSSESLLENPEPRETQLEFSEHLRAHDRQITPILRFIMLHVKAGVDEDSWYEEQLYFLLERMHALHAGDARSAKLISAARPSTRRELFRRVCLAVNFINTNWAQQITLDHIAAAALLSRFHCLRVFKDVYGVTPIAFLNQRRVKTASRLLHSGQHSVNEVAKLAGFRSRVTLFRQIRRAKGISPKSVKFEIRPEDSDLAMISCHVRDACPRLHEEV